MPPELIRKQHFVDGHKVEAILQAVDGLMYILTTSKSCAFFFLDGTCKEVQAKTNMEPGVFCAFGMGEKATAHETFQAALWWKSKCSQ